MDTEKEIYLFNLGVLEALHRLPDGAALTPDEAAIFLRTSPGTLERRRKTTNDGPNYVQAGAKGAKGVNQKITYIKGDLIIWQKSNKVTDSMSAAVRRGQAYLPFTDPTPKRSSYDLTTKRPFYRDKNSKVAGCVDTTPVNEIIDRLGKWEFEWLSPINAASKVWSDQPAHYAFAERIKVALEVAMKRIETACSPQP
jgi:hypothetical protein